jgi:hypothetical protein
MAGHEMSSNNMPCDIEASDCSLADELNYDGRAAKLELKHSPGDSPLAILPIVSTDAVPRHESIAGWHSTRSPPPAPTVPLNIFYCIYLI